MNLRIEASAGVGGTLGKHAGSHHATGSLGVATFPWGTQRCLGGQSDPDASHRCVRLLFLRTRSPKGASQAVLVVENPPANTGDIRDSSSIPGSGRSPGGGHGNPLQYSWLEEPMDRGAQQATVHRVAKSRTRLKQLSTARQVA